MTREDQSETGCRLAAADGPREEVEPALGGGHGERELELGNLSCGQTVDTEWSSQET